MKYPSMKKTSIVIGSMVLALMACDSANAAAASVAGKNFALTGKFGVSVVVSCRVGGTHSQKVAKQKNLVSNIRFNEDGSFEWYGDALQIGATGVGEWTQKGSKIDLDFTDKSMSYLQVFGNQTLNTYSQGASFNANTSPVKYNFSAKLVGKDGLTVTETGGFKASAQASYQGHSNSCGYRVNLTRTYKGKAQ